MKSIGKADLEAWLQGAYQKLTRAQVEIQVIQEMIAWLDQEETPTIPKKVKKEVSEPVREEEEEEPREEEPEEAEEEEEEADDKEEEEEKEEEDKVFNPLTQKWGPRKEVEEYIMKHRKKKHDAGKDSGVEEKEEVDDF